MAKAKTTPRATADFARARSEAKLIAERDDANARAAAANVECAKSRDETQLLKKENARLTALIEEHDRVRKFLSTEKTALRLRLQSAEQKVAKLERAVTTMAIEYSELDALHEERELSHKVGERQLMTTARRPGISGLDSLRYGIDRTAVRDTV